MKISDSLNLKLGIMEFTPFFFLLIAAVLFFDEGYIMPAMGLAATAHEAGHFAAIKKFGGKIEKICFGFCGLTAKYSGRLSYRQEIISAAAGPAAGVFLAVAAAFAARKTGAESLYYTAGISALYSAFNILPLPVLDGGRMLKFTLCELTDTSMAERISFVVMCVVVILMVLAGVLLQIYSAGNNLLLFSFGFVIFFIAKEIKVL